MTLSRWLARLKTVPRRGGVERRVAVAGVLVGATSYERWSPGCGGELETVRRRGFLAEEAAAGEECPGGARN